MVRCDWEWDSEWEWEYSCTWYWKYECECDNLQQRAGQIEDKVDEIEFFYMLLLLCKDKKITRGRLQFRSHMIYEDKKRRDTKFGRENQHQPSYTSETHPQDLER